jgi:hypothetical protein
MVFGARPKAYLREVPAVEFGFGDVLSPTANTGLEQHERGELALGPEPVDEGVVESPLVGPPLVG